MLKNLILFCVVVLSLVGCTSKTKKSEPEFLFVIVSKFAEIQTKIDGNFQLVLDHKHIENVVAFSDRPDRLATHMTGEDFVMRWKKHGPNSFGKDHPNAAVIINNHIQTVELLDVEITDTKTTFPIRVIGVNSLQEMAGASQLFIDFSWGDFLNDACIEPPCPGV